MLGSASLRSAWYGRIENSSTTCTTSHTDRQGRKLSLETPLDRSFPLPHCLYPFPFTLLAPESSLLPSSPLSSLTVPSSSSLALSLSRSFCLLLPLLVPLTARSCSFSTVVRVPSFSRVYVGKALDISGRRPRETQFLGACSATLPWTVAVTTNQARRYLDVRLTPRNVAREENRELWHNFRRRRRRARLLLATSDPDESRIVSNHSSVCVNNRNFVAHQLRLKLI